MKLYLAILFFVIPIAISSVESSCPLQVSLKEALAFTIENQPEIKISELNIEIQGGIAQSRGGPFDPVLDADFTTTSMKNLQNPTLGLKTDLTGYENIAHVNVNKTTRCGTRYMFNATVDQIKNPLMFLQKTNIGTVSFFINQPLMRNLCFSLDTANERAAYIELFAVQYDSLQTLSEKLFNTAFQYWEAIAAYKAFQVNSSAVERLKELTKRIETLIKEDQLAREDIKQPLQRIAVRELRVEQLKQSYYSNIQALKLAMGDVDLCQLDADSLLLVDNFPKVLETPPCYRFMVTQLIDYALTYRFDILASFNRELVTDVLLRGAKNFALPEVDLIGGVTRRNFTKGREANNFLSPFDSRKPQTDWTIGVKISVPFHNDEAIGLVRQRAAEKLQSSLRTTLLSQTAISELRSAFEDHLSLMSQLKIAEENVALTKKLIETENKKLPEGYSNLFILLDFEDRLTDALTEVVLIYKNYLQNMARIRFLTGAMIRWDPYTNLVKLLDLLTLPSKDEENICTGKA